MTLQAYISHSRHPSFHPFKCLSQPFLFTLLTQHFGHDFLPDTWLRRDPMQSSHQSRTRYANYMEEKCRRQEEKIQHAEALRELQAERVRHRQELDRLKRLEQERELAQRLERAREHSMVRVFSDLAAVSAQSARRRSRLNPHDGNENGRGEHENQPQDRSTTAATATQFVLRKGPTTVTARPIAQSNSLHQGAKAVLAEERRNQDGFANGNHPSKSTTKLKMQVKAKYLSGLDEWGSPLATFSQLRREYMAQNPHLKISSLTPSIDRRIDEQPPSPGSTPTAALTVPPQINLTHDLSRSPSGGGNSSRSSTGVSPRKPRWHPVNPAMARAQLAAGWQALPLFAGCPYEDPYNIRIWRDFGPESEQTLRRGNRPPWSRGATTEAKKRIERPGYLYTHQSFSAPGI